MVDSKLCLLFSNGLILFCFQGFWTAFERIKKLEIQSLYYKCKAVAWSYWQSNVRICKGSGRMQLVKMLIGFRWLTNFVWSCLEKRVHTWWQRRAEQAECSNNTNRSEHSRLSDHRRLINDTRVLVRLNRSIRLRSLGTWFWHQIFQPITWQDSKLKLSTGKSLDGAPKLFKH